MPKETRLFRVELLLRRLRKTKCDEPEINALLVEVTAELESIVYCNGFKIGDEIETIKGAKFRGRILRFYNEHHNPGAVVEAEHPQFQGTRHVYPLTQLGLAE